VSELTVPESSIGSPDQRFPALLYLSPQPISLSELASGRFIEVNQAWLDFFGFARDEVIGKSRGDLSMWVSMEDRTRLRRALEQGTLVRNEPCQCRKKSGEIADILFTCDPVDFGGLPCVYAALNDVTALRRAERLLALSEERFGRIFDAVPQSITIARLSDSVFLEANPASERMYGYTREELVGQPVQALGLWVDPEERSRAIESLPVGETGTIETRMRHKSGRVIDAHCT